VQDRQWCRRYPQAAEPQTVDSGTSQIRAAQFRLTHLHLGDCNAGKYSPKICTIKFIRHPPDSTRTAFIAWICVLAKSQSTNRTPVNRAVWNVLIKRRLQFNAANEAFRSAAHSDLQTADRNRRFPVLPADPAPLGSSCLREDSFSFFMRFFPTHHSVVALECVTLFRELITNIL